jgi:hypothetical protein
MSSSSNAFAAAAAAGAAAATEDGVGRVNTRSRAASAAASAAASRSASRCPSPPRAAAAADDCSSLAAALCAKLAPLQSKALPRKRAAATKSSTSSTKSAKTASAKTAPEASRREAPTEDSDSSEDEGSCDNVGNVGNVRCAFAQRGNVDNVGSIGNVGKPAAKAAKASRKRSPAQVCRANNVNMVRRALDDNIKVLLGDATQAARPLPADRFTEEELSSILCCKGYTVPIGFDVPLFIAGVEKPIYANAASSRSAYARAMPLVAAAFAAIDTNDYESQRAAAAKLCSPTKANRHKRATFTSSASSASSAPFAIRIGVPACLNGHTLIALTSAKETACSICGCGCRDFKSCSDLDCRGSSAICDGCLNYLAPNTQAAFFIVAAAELVPQAEDADFDHAEAIAALGNLSTANGNVVPLDGRQIAGLKLHRESDDDAEIVGNYSAITTATRDILLKALTHTHNTPETAFDMFIKASALGDAVAKSDTTIATLRAKLQRMEAESADLKRIHATAAHLVACSKLRAVGQLPQSPVVSGKERAVMKRISFAAAAPAAAAASEDEEMADAAGGAAPTADDSSDSDSSDSSDSDSSDSDSD